MAICAICGKKTTTGYSVSHSHRRTKRRLKPNLIKTKLADPSGKLHQVRICAKCLKAITKGGKRLKGLIPRTNS